MISPTTIRSTLQQAHPGAQIDVIDTKGDGYHFQINITCAKLSQLPPVKGHQAVYQALGPELTGTIHAVSIHIQSPKSTAASGPHNL